MTAPDSTDPNPPLVSVVIPVHNGAKDLPLQLSALSNQTYAGRWELVVADNRSDDGSAEVAMSYADRLPIRVIDAHETGSQAYALNRGVEASRGNLLLLLDADDEVDQGYVAAMVAALVSHDFVTARLDCSSLNPGWVGHSRPAGQQDDIGAPFGFLPVAAGCAIGVKRSAFDAIGGFAEDLPVCQDIDFSWRLQQAGFDLHFVTEAVLRYRYRDQLGSIYRQARGYGYSGPMLYRRYREDGMPRRRFKASLRFWLGPLRVLLTARDRAGFAQVVFLAGFRVGMLRGSIAERVIYL